MIEWLRAVPARLVLVALMARGLVAVLATLGLGFAAATLAGGGSPLGGVVALVAASLLGAIALRELRAARREWARGRAWRRVHTALRPLAHAGWHVRGRVRRPAGEPLDFLVAAPDRSLLFAIAALDRAPGDRELDRVQEASAWLRGTGRGHLAVCAVADTGAPSELSAGILVSSTERLAGAVLEAHAAFADAASPRAREAPSALWPGCAVQ